MNININTKYNIGDTVYIVDSCYDYYPVNIPCIVKNIFIRGNINNIYVNYEVQHDTLSLLLPESWIFPTYAECTKWCEEHNKISYTLPS
jgi:hypothetical protein